MSVSLELTGELSLGEVLRLPGLAGLVVVGLSSGKLCVFDHMSVRNGISSTVGWSIRGRVPTA